MNRNQIIDFWNQGKFNLILERFDFQSLENSIEIYFYLDSYLQLKKFKEINKILEEHPSIYSDNEEFILIKKILLIRISILLGQFSNLEQQLNDTELENSYFKNRLDGWLYFNYKLIESILFYIKNDFHNALQPLYQLEKEYMDLEQKFSGLNSSIYYNTKGTIEWKSGEKSNALLDITKSMRINKKFNNILRLAHDILIRGLIYVDLGEFLKSLVDFEDAKSIFDTSHDDYGQKIVQLSIAEVKFIQGKLSEALTIFESSLVDLSGNVHQLSEVYLLIGKIYQKKRNFEKALDNYEKALELANKLQFVYYHSLIILNIIDLLIETNNKSKIMQYKEKFVKNADDKIIQSIKLMINALLYHDHEELLISKQTWIQLASDKFLPLHLKIYTLENALKTSIMLWKEEKEITLLQEIENIIETWEKLATDNFLMSSLATIYLLKAKFYLAVIQTKEAKHFLEEGLKIVEKFGLEIDRDDIASDQEKIRKIEQLKSVRVMEDEDISLDEMLDYLKHAKTNILMEKS